MFGEGEFRRVMLPLICMNVAFATGSLEYFTSRSRRVIGSIFFLVLPCTIYVYRYIMRTQEVKAYVNNVSFLQSFTIQMQLYGTLLLLFLCVVNGIARMNRVKLIVAQVESCDTKLEKIGVPKNYRSHIVYQYYMIMIVCVLSLIYIVLCILIINTLERATIITYFLAFIDYYPSLMCLTCDMTYVFWVRYFKMKFTSLNDQLQNMLSTTIDSPQHKRVLHMNNDMSENLILFYVHRGRETEENFAKVKAVRQIHLQLIKCANYVNDTYGRHLVCSVTIFSVFITALLYNCYTMIWGNQEISYLLCAFFLYWVVYPSLEICIVSHECAITTTRASDIGDTICELYVPSATKEYRTEIRDFMLQLIQNPLVFSACGFFDLNHSFIHEIIGSIGTYLVILIQMDQSETNETNSTLITTEVSTIKV